jgi:amidase
MYTDLLNVLVIPISSHQDTVGPMTHTVAAILPVIAGPDLSDNATIMQP